MLIDYHHIVGSLSGAEAFQLTYRMAQHRCVEPNRINIGRPRYFLSAIIEYLATAVANFVDKAKAGGPKMLIFCDLSGRKYFRAFLFPQRAHRLGSRDLSLDMRWAVRDSVQGGWRPAASARVSYCRQRICYFVLGDRKGKQVCPSFSLRKGSYEKTRNSNRYE